MVVSTRPAPIDGAHRGTAAQMAAHQTQRIHRHAQHLCGTFGDVAVRGAVKAVAPNAVLLAPLGRDSIARGVLGHGGVELRLEGGDQRDARHGFTKGAYRRQVDGSCAPARRAGTPPRPRSRPSSITKVPRYRGPACTALNATASMPASASLDLRPPLRDSRARAPGGRGPATRSEGISRIWYFSEVEPRLGIRIFMRVLRKQRSKSGFLSYHLPLM